jgi:hypothetical protein
MSHAEKLILVLAAAAAQSTDRDADFAGAVSAAQAALQQNTLPQTMGTAAAKAAVQAAAAPAAKSQSCPDAKELETSFVLIVAGRELPFTYAGCDQEERNDYLAPYTERSYKGLDGFGLTIVTKNGWEPGGNYDGTTSEVLVSKGKDWVASSGEIANAKLVSGQTVDVGTFKVHMAGDYPQTRVCDQGIKKLAGYSPRDSQGKVAVGFNTYPSLVLLNDSQAYYYHEDCDICAELDVCDLKTGQTRAALVEHSVSCSDMDPYRQERGEVYSACPNRIAQLSCVPVTKNAYVDYAITGQLDLGTTNLKNSRSGDSAKLIDASRKDVMDERCGKAAMALAQSLNFYVTPRHYWGEDILQLPKAVTPGPGSFDANLHVCQYDGDWSDSDNVALRCTLTAQP